MDENNEENVSVVEGDMALIKRNIPQKRDRFLPISILIAAILIAGSVVFTTFYRGGSPSGGAGAGANPAAPNNPATPSSTVSAAQIMTLGSRDAILGNANAPVTIIEYGDYQCPFCGQFYSQTQSLIVTNYVNSGKVRMVFRDFPFLGPESTAASDAARCAGDQGKLWPYHDALYQAKMNDDANGGSENDGIFTNKLFEQLAGKVGLNVTTFASCLSANTDANVVADEKSTAVAAGVDSTPTFFINGAEITGAQPYAVFQQAIDSALTQ